MRFENFRSFKERTVFKMEAESICEFKDSIIKWNRNKTDEFRVVPLHIMYGQNASGKSNVLLGIALMKDLIEKGSLNRELCLDLKDAPYLKDKVSAKKPTTLGIEFVCNAKVFDYEITFQCLEKPVILHEVLFVNRSKLFERNKRGITLAKNNKAVEYFDEKRISNLEINEKQCADYDEQDLYLNIGFKCFIATALVNEMRSFFLDHMFIYMDSNCLLESFDHLKHKKEVKQYLQSIDFDHPLDGSCPLSVGTHKFIMLCDLLFEAMDKGHMVLIDEMDNSINPNLIIQLVYMFHDRNLNKNDAQLIFNTHNPLYLDKNLIRRDEITFVTMKENGTELKSLIEYANRENNYLRKYIGGEYETIPVIDFDKLYA